jgi:hypothetical protein
MVAHALPKFTLHHRSFAAAKYIRPALKIALLMLAGMNGLHGGDQLVVMEIRTAGPAARARSVCGRRQPL